MKLLFLVRHETIIPSTGAFYDFLPYQYGPYSFAADRDLWELMRNGVAVGDKLQLTEWRQAEALTAYEALAAPVRVAPSSDYTQSIFGTGQFGSGTKSTSGLRLRSRKTIKTAARRATGRASTPSKF
ncbi:MAG: hypothetical protein M3Y74_05355 [Chloroflexota bacterium]|nr:hypothetical protein [Chloroflexota bacterium]